MTNGEALIEQRQVLNKYESYSGIKFYFERITPTVFRAIVAVENAIVSGISF